MWRAVRLVVDTGIHDQGWSRQQAIDFFAANAAKSMKRESIKFEVDVGIGKGEATIWTCDFTDRYISINADYRS